MRGVVCAGWLVFLVGAGQAAAEGTEVKLTSLTSVRFASADEGRAVLTAADAFTAGLSRFDIQCRMKTDREVQLADWKRFVAEHVRTWEPAEMEAVTQSLTRLSERLGDFRLPLPTTLLLVRTNGDEEGGAAYTRGTAIILPTRVLAYQPNQLDRLLAHELFHILSRHDGATRVKLYRIIGFESCEPIDPPSSLAPRRITNPDAPLIDCTIELPVTNIKDVKTVTAAPILYSTRPYDAARGGSLFEYLTFRLFVVEQQGGRWQPVLARGEPFVIDPRKEPAFLDKVGRNTSYIIHPDEILADNFVRLVMGDKDLETPRIIEEMRRALR